MGTRTEHAAAVLAPGAGERLPVLLDTITEKLTGGATPFEVHEVDGPTGSGPPPHSHPWTECFYVLDGAIEVDLDGVQARAEAGSFVRIPAGTLHTFVIASDGTRFLSITEGESAGRFFRDLATLGPVAPDAEHLPAIVEVAKRNLLTSPLF